MFNMIDSVPSASVSDFSDTSTYAPVAFAANVTAPLGAV